MAQFGLNNVASKLNFTALLATIALSFNLYPSAAYAQSASGGAGTAKAMGLVGAAVNAGVAAYFGSTCPKPESNCAFAALYAVQTVSSLQGAASAGGSQGATASSFNPDFGSNLPNLNGPNTGSLTPAQEQSLLSADPALAGPLANLNKANQALKNAAVVISPDGQSMTLPDGQTMSLAGGAGSALSGLTPKQMAAAKSKLAQLTKKYEALYNVAPVATTASGAAGIKGITNGAGGSGDSGFNIKPFAFNMGVRAPASASIMGMSRNYHGDKIGVAQESIFQMVSRRYQIERANHAFLDN